MLHTDRAVNAREECKKIKNIAKTVSQVTSICTLIPFRSDGVPCTADQRMNHEEKHEQVEQLAVVESCRQHDW